MAAIRIPDEINVELLLNYFSNKDIKVFFRGLHKRNTYMDVISFDDDGYKFLITLGRNSLYNSLPEYIFHPIDRFDKLSHSHQKEAFEEEYLKQEKEKEDAYKFFAPLDILLLQLRLEIRNQIESYVRSNKTIEDIILDNMTQEQKQNEFIKQTKPYLPSCKYIRGDRTLLTLLLRKVLLDEGIIINELTEKLSYTDDNPRYADCLDSSLDDLFLGNEYAENSHVYRIHYWSDDYCNEKFLDFVSQIEVYRQFIQDYFLSVDSLLVFDIHKDMQPLRLSDTTIYNYLNFNANI